MKNLKKRWDSRRFLKEGERLRKLTLKRFLICFLFLSVYLITKPAIAGDEYFKTGIGGNGEIMISSGDASFLGQADTYESIFENYKRIVQAIYGLCSITAILFLFIYITKWGACGENQRERQNAHKGILFSGIAVALFGSLELFISFFWNLFV